MKKSIYLLMLLVLSIISSCSDDDNPKIIENANSDLLWVNLGLPSGTLWADRNVDAAYNVKPGGYYGWGECETKDKSDYDKEHCPTYRRDIPNISGNSEYDVATRKLGEDACIPTIEQWKELCNNCRWIWIDDTGAEGMLVIGPNNNQIFLPAVGFIHAGEQKGCGHHTLYWSSSPYENDNTRAYHLDCWEDETPEIGIYTRYIGMPIRPVHK